MAKKQTSEANLVKEPRRLKQASYKRGRFSKRIKHPGPALLSGWRLLRQSLKTINSNKRIFVSLLGVYVLLSVILVQGFSGTAGISETKSILDAEASLSSLDKGATLLGSLFGSGSANGAASSIYQTILLVIMSLATIWVLRQVSADEAPKKIKVKQAFYNSTTPLIPFLIVVFFISLQLIPFVIGSGVYTIIGSSGLAATFVESVAWGGLFFLLALWSLYMITASIFALYIVTLPDLMPRQAMRSARRLVQFRRWTVMRKLVFLPVVLLVAISIIMLPILLWLTAIAQPVFYLLSLASLFIVHSYLYGLYRELLK